MHTRLNELRTTLDLSLAQMGNALNMSPSSISLLENGKRNLTDRTIADICRIYHVNEHWLRTGEGEMFQEKTRAVEIAEMTAAMAGSDPTSMKYQFMKLIAGMTPEQIEVFKELSEQLQKNIKDAQDKKEV